MFAAVSGYGHVVLMSPRQYPYPLVPWNGFSGCLTLSLKCSKITNWVKLINQKRHNKILLNSFPTNGDTLGVRPHNQKLEDFVSPEV